MASVFDFPPSDRELLKVAAKTAKKAYGAANKACERALMTDETTAALTMVGYCDEAARFLENPEGIARESSDEDATDAERDEVVKLGFHHIVALRTGLLLRIDMAEGIVEEQEEIFADTDATQKRIGDFRRLEAQLRGMTSDQSDLFVEHDPEITRDGADESEAAADESLFDGPQGPFDAPAATERLALPSGTAEIAEADFEIVDGGDDERGDGDVADGASAAAAEDGAVSDVEAAARDPKVAGHIAPAATPLTDDLPVDVEGDDDDAPPAPGSDAWLNESLRDDKAAKA